MQRAAYARTGRPELLDAALAGYRRAVESTAAGTPAFASYLDSYGMALLDRHERTGSVDDLDAAVRTMRQSREATPPDSAAFAGVLNNLGHALWSRHAYHPDGADLDDALAAFGRAVELTPTTSPDAAIYRDNLANALADRFTRGEDPADLDRAVAGYEAALAGPSGDVERARIETNLAVALLTRYRTAHHPPDLDRAVAILDGVVERTPPTSPVLTVRLNNLGVALHHRGRRDDDRGDARPRAGRPAPGLRARLAGRHALGAGRGATLAGWAAEERQWAEAADAYRTALTIAADYTGVQLSRRSTSAALAQLRPLSADAAYALSRAGARVEAVVAAERGRAVLLGRALALDDVAVRGLASSIRDSPNGSARRPIGWACSWRGPTPPDRHRGAARDGLVVAAGRGRAAVRRRGLVGGVPGHRRAGAPAADRRGGRRARRPRRRGRAARRRGCRTCLRSAPRDAARGPDRGARAARRADRRRGAAAVAEPLGRGGVVLRAVPAEPTRPRMDAVLNGADGVLTDPAFPLVAAERRGGMAQAVAGLAIARYRATDEGGDLDRAVELYRLACAQFPATDPDHAAAASALGSALCERYERSGAPLDLDDGIGWTRRAVAGAPDDERWLVLHNLAVNLGMRYALLGAPDDLIAALAAVRNALAADPPEDAAPRLVHTSAGLLVDRFERDGVLEDLEAAAELVDAVLPATTTPEPRAPLRVILASIAQLHFSVDGEVVRLEEAAGQLRRAVRELGRRSAYRPLCLQLLGSVLLTAWEAAGDPAALRAALDALRRADADVLPTSPRAAQFSTLLGLAEVRRAADRPVRFRLGRRHSDPLSAAIERLRRAASAAVEVPRLLPFALVNLGHRAVGPAPARPVDRRPGRGYHRLPDGGRPGRDRGSPAGVARRRGVGRLGDGPRRLGDADTAYRSGIDAVDLLRGRQLVVGHKRAWIALGGGLAGKAATAAVRAGEARHAVTDLERCRAQLLGEQLATTQVDLSRLDRCEPELAHCYRVAATRVRALEAQTPYGEHGGRHLCAGPGSGQPAIRPSTTRRPAGSRTRSVRPAVGERWGRGVRGAALSGLAPAHHT